MTRRLSVLCALAVTLAILALDASLSNAGVHTRELAARRLAQLAAASPGQAQGSPLEPLAAGWAYTYGGPAWDSGIPVVTTTDTGRVLSGTTKSFGAGNTDLLLFKVDALGNVLWQKTYGTTYDDYGSIVPTSDGGFFASGSSNMGSGQNQPFLARLDSAGIVQWSKKYGAPGVGYGGFYQVTNGYLATGHGTVLAIPVINYVLKIMKLDSLGSILWEKVFSSTTQQRTAYNVLQLADQGFVVCGTVMNMATYSTDLWLMRLSSTGAVLWQYTYGGPDAEAGAAILPTADGGFFLQATTRSWGPPVGEDGTGNLWLLRLGSDGAIVWQKAYGTTGKEWLVAIPASDGGYVLSGSSDASGAGADDAVLAKLNANGDFQWGKTYGSAQDDDAYAEQDPSGGYLVIGSTAPVDSPNEDALVLKTDGSGNLTWQRVYGRSGDHDAVGLDRLTDGTLLLVGTTNSVGAGDVDAVLGVLDSQGRLPGSCPFIKDGALTTGTFALTVATTTATRTAAALNPTDGTTTAAAYTLTVGTPALTRKDLCTSASVLSATATASVTSGSAPLAVAFTGAGSGGTPPYSYSWDFGDDTATSTQQNPSHTYGENGMYQVVLTVRDSAGASATDNHIYVTVGGGGSCPTCDASAAATGSPGSPVSFTATVQLGSCTGTPVYYWDFGDGGFAMTQNATHAYAEAGTYGWTFRVMVGAQVCEDSGTITIGGGGEEYNAWVPSVAHKAGSAGSNWRTSIAAVNRAATEAAITLTYLPQNGSTPLTREATLGAGETVEWEDILASQFEVAEGSGTVKVTSNVPLVITSRTYNDTPDGTYGQYYPAVTEATVLPEGETGVIPQLKNNTGYRTNVGVQNIGSSPASVEIKLFGQAGTQVGTTVTRTVPAGLYVQVDRIFTNVAGAGNQDIAYATVRATTAGAKIWAYGSVVDNVTSDPTTVPLLWGASALTRFVPSVAHSPGSLGSNWRSSLAVVNRGASAAALVLTFTPYDTGSPVIRNYNLPAGATKEWEDVLVRLFNQTAESVKGCVMISSNRAIYATSRTFNQAANGTFGQYYPSVALADGIVAGQVGVVPQLKKTTGNTGYRTNVGIQNVGVQAVTVAIKLFDAWGTQVGITKTQQVAVNRYWQQDDVFKNLQAGDREIAYATVEVQTASGRAWAYGSVVDNQTSDPTTVPLLLQP